MRVAPWGLEPPQRAALFRELTFRYHKWDVHACGAMKVLDEALVLPAPLHQEVVRIGEAFAALLARLEARIASEPALLARLGIPPSMYPLLRDEAPCPLQLGRYDLHPTEDGRWMVSEFNEDVPGGFNEAVGIPDLLGDFLPGATFLGDLRRSMVAALDPYDTIATLFATGYSEDLQHMLVVEDWLRDAGHATVSGSPAHLRRRLFHHRVHGQRIDAAVRYYPGEWFPRLPNFATWQRAGALPMMNPLRRLIRQSKHLFWLWREAGLLTPDEETFVEVHAPFTARFDPRAHEAMLRDEPARWVLKTAFGRMGDAVYLGAIVPPPAWDKAIREAKQRPSDWLVQERFVHTPLAFAAGPLYPAIGIFLVNGRFAGYYSRASAKPILTHEALHVATVVEAA